MKAINGRLIEINKLWGQWIEGKISIEWKKLQFTMNNNLIKEHNIPTLSNWIQWAHNNNKLFFYIT